MAPLTLGVTFAPLTVVVLAVGLVLDRKPWRLAPEPTPVQLLRTPEFAALTPAQQNKQLRDAVLTNTDRFRQWVRRFVIFALLISVGTTFAVWGVERASHDTCITFNHRLRSLIDGLTPQVSTKGVHDPATLARIKATNAQRAAAQRQVAGFLRDNSCPS